MKVFKHFGLYLFIGIAALMSCSSDDDEETTVTSSESSPIAEVTYTLSRTTSYGNDWIYFSLSEGAEVDVDEDSHATDLSWDLAFNRYNVRTNGGASGSGEGGAYDTGETVMSAVTVAPTEGYTLDTESEITASFTGSGVTYDESTLNSLLAEAIVFEAKAYSGGYYPSYTPNFHVYVIKTADGKYAKVQIQGFYDDEGNSGYVTFTYAYQPDGTTNLTSK